jgi:hypothetical protein
MTFYVVICELRVTGIHAESVHRTKAQAEQKAEEVVEGLYAEAVKRLGDGCTRERYMDSWTINEGETATVYVMEAEFDDK